MASGDEARHNRERISLMASAQSFSCRGSLEAMVGGYLALGENAGRTP